MDNRKPLHSFLPVSIALLMISSAGIAVSASIAEAKPPAHAPARGYRCKNDRSNANCKQQKNQNNRRNNSDNDNGDNDDPYNNDQSTNEGYTLSANTVLDLEYSGSRTITLRRNQTYSITLRVVRDIRNTQNQVLIPRNTRVEGEFRPTNGGFQFVARRLRLSNGNSYQINATSRTFYGTEELANGDIGSQRSGDLASIIADAVTGNRTNSNVMVLQPNTQIQMILNSDLTMR
ncbi:hypothetical protein Cri9333_1138 [Crinalium epipsammum PCC 9333]|uniref:Uncharacterized protein n=1 Tax=Crinalium epipsammum PCC 9333 TaxID=1173022 RepID=K9VY39_9CYAN|nr:hypothetical protein [Crinalium epipsammum]AFZ12045.1 hypothetical protein Cri9333_1138 [Crinalium epipsammum PCC 9333]